MLRERIKAGEFGAITTPASNYDITDMPVWAADNGCFGKGYPGDAKYLAWLARPSLQAARARCLFATAPDVVCDAAATLDRFGQFAPTMRGMGYRVALVAQNGLEHLPVPWGQFQVLFIGGDDRWKLGPAAAQLAGQAIERGIRVHMGRVNGGGRWAYARAIGCSTADGKCVNIAPDKNVGRPAQWQKRPVQGVIF